MTGFTALSQVFGYDDADRLDDWDRQGTAAQGLAVTQDWTLSKVGDWIDTTVDSQFETRTHNAVHELTQRAVTGQASVDLSYDAKGNLTHNGKTLTMAWDYENRMTAALNSPGLGVAGAPAGDLVIYWPLDEAQGSTAGDAGAASAPVVDGAVSGAQWLDRARIGAGISCDGSYDTITNTTTAASALNGLSAVTLSLWVKSNLTGVDKGICFAGAPVGSDDNLGMRYDAVGFAGGGTSGIKASIQTTAGVATLETPSNTQSTEWQHLALVWTSGDVLRLYINGVETVPTAVSPALGGTITGVDRMLLGRGARSKFWDGNLDELRVYSRALSAAEIASLATPNTYRYDALGRRVQKQVGTSVTTFVCAGAQVFAEYGGGVGSANPDRNFVYASYVDEPVALAVPDGSGGTDVSYYHSNHLYSVAALTDDTGVVLERYGYGPYGDSVVYDASGSVIAESTVGNPYRFTGRRLDGETGLSYFRARYMDHEMGRFVGRDPLGYVDGMSTYTGYFVPNGVDPTGNTVPSGVSVQVFENEDDPDHEAGDHSRIAITLGGTIAVEDCQCCSDIYWRQYVRQWAVSDFGDYGGFVLQIPGQTQGWQLDGGERYPHQTSGRVSGLLGDAVVVNMEDEPGMPPLAASLWRYTYEQEFMSQLICVKGNGSEIALSEPIYWRHSFNPRRNPKHIWRPSAGGMLFAQAYNCDESKPVATPPEGRLPMGHFSKNPPAPRHREGYWGPGPNAPHPGGVLSPPQLSQE